MKRSIVKSLREMPTERCNWFYSPANIRCCKCFSSQDACQRTLQCFQRCFYHWAISSCGVNV